MIKDEPGKRMKENYEEAAKFRLLRRTPVAIRIDGKAFHTFTRGFDKPFDDVLMKSMDMTMVSLCKNIQGCVLGYTQSDEITLILIDYQNLNSQPWFNYEVQKMCSVSASIATAAFNEYYEIFRTSNRIKHHSQEANFDSRCFNIPREEVTNLLYWRQVDAIRNSTEMVGRTYFSQKELMNKSQDDIKTMLLEQKNVSVDSYYHYYTRGRCCIKTKDGWLNDYEIPIFKGEGREYVEKRINVGG